MWKRERTVRDPLEDVLTKSAPPVDTAQSEPVQVAPDLEDTQPATTIPDARRVEEPVVAQQNRASVLGPSLRFSGDLIADEDLVVQGHIEGSIFHSRSLTIGREGLMKGDIKARRITVEGSVNGDLHAFENATLRSTARVRGNIYANEVSVAEGARLSGRVDMDNAPKVPQVAPRFSQAALPEKATAPAKAAADLTDPEVGDLLAGS
jgi:cytoskeletal protein CcmA (bactofilin family)